MPPRKPWVEPDEPLMRLSVRDSEVRVSDIGPRSYAIDVLRRGDIVAARVLERTGKWNAVDVALEMAVEHSILPDFIVLRFRARASLAATEPVGRRGSGPKKKGGARGWGKTRGKKEEDDAEK